MDDSSLFINRREELKLLINDIDKERRVSRCIIVSAKSGIGKTELVNQAFRNYLNGEFRVKVSIDSTKEIGAGYFFKEITKIVHKNAIEFKEYKSITNYVKTNNFYRGLAIGIAKTISKYLGVKYFEEGFAKGVSKPELKKWISNDNELLQICLGYLLNVLHKNRILIAIENIQKIDEKSLKLIRELLLSTNNLYMVGEYTIIENHSESDGLLKFLDVNEIDINRLKVEKIPKNELIDAVVNEKDLIISILENTYDKSDGNLHKFKLLKKTINSEKYNISIRDYDTVTSSILNSLNAKGTMLFGLIEAHTGKILKQILWEFLEFDASYNNVDIKINTKTLEDLRTINLVETDDEWVSIHHDSLSTDFKKNPPFRKIYPIVARKWVRFYQYKESRPISSEEDFVQNLLWQVHFFLKLNSFDEISLVLQKLNRLISESPYNTVINYLDVIARAIRNNDGQKKQLSDANIIRWLVIMYYRCGFSKKILNLVEPKEMEDPIILLCYMASASTTSEKHDFVLEYINSIENHIQNEKLKLGLILIKIRTLRSAYKLKEAYNLWKRHQEKKTFVGTSFEPSFLKYSSIAIHEDFEFRIDCLSKSAQIYENQNDTYGKVSVLNTLARDYALIKKTDFADSYLSEAEKLSSNFIYPKYHFYNNRSALDIMNREVTTLTRDRLINALRICTNEGNQMIISSNLLCYYILGKNQFQGYRLYNNLAEKVINSFDKESLIDQICLYNCYRFAITMNREKEAQNLIENYLKKMSFRRHPKLWDFLLLKSEMNPFDPVITREIYPHFIVDWEVDYYNALNNY